MRGKRPEQAAGSRDVEMGDGENISDSRACAGVPGVLRGGCGGDGE